MTVRTRVEAVLARLVDRRLRAAPMASAGKRRVPLGLGAERLAVRAGVEARRALMRPTATPVAPDRGTMAGARM